MAFILFQLVWFDYDTVRIHGSHLPVLNSSPNFSRAEVVYMVSLPGWVPGAKSSALRLSTTTTSTPGGFWRLCLCPCLTTTSKGPRGFCTFFPWFYPFRIVCFPFLARTTSSMSPSFLRSPGLPGLFMLQISSSTTRGTWGTFPIWWPRASTRS